MHFVGLFFSLMIELCLGLDVLPAPSVRINAYCLDSVKGRLHESPRLINAVESMKLNSTVERYCLHGPTKVNEAVDSKIDRTQE